MARLFVSILGTVRDWTVAAAGEAKGRAASEAEHAEAAREAERTMQQIARTPLTREELRKRLEEGGA